MGAGFNKRTSVLRRRNDRERLLFITAAGLAFSLLVIMLVVLSNRPADARQNQVVPPASQIPPALGTVTLYTPERQVRPGVKLSDVNFKEVYWPRNQVPEGAVRDLAELKDMYSKAVIEPGVPVQHSLLSNQPVEDALPLTPGNRAISIEIDQVSGLEGHALPGTKVDVTLTYMKEQQLTTKIIVQNARVLSYGGVTKAELANATGKTERVASKTITLDVAPGDALQIQTARQMGRLGLMMRTQDDDKAPSVTELSGNDIQGSRKERPAPQRACTKGTVKVAGKEMVIGCDGTISELTHPDSPVAK